MKNKIKVISFDLWGTLIKSNPEYKRLRAEYISQYTNKSLSEICNIIDTIKKDVDAGVEKFGFHYNTVDVYIMIHVQCEIIGITWRQLQLRCIDLFVQNPPILFDGVELMLSVLVLNNYKLYLSSNTLLIDGNTLRTVLKNMDISKYFVKRLFSNELGVSKPNPEFFKHLHILSGCLRNEIIHVGDNPKTDTAGASNYGIEYFLVSEYETVLDFFNSFTNDMNVFKIVTGSPVFDKLMTHGIPMDKISMLCGTSDVPAYLSKRRFLQK